MAIEMEDCEDVHVNGSTFVNCETGVKATRVENLSASRNRMASSHQRLSLPLPKIVWRRDELSVGAYRALYGS